MSKLSVLLARAKVIVTSLPTYLTIAVVVLTDAEREIGTIFTIPPHVTQWVARVITVLAAAALFIRTHMPVAKQYRGLLPTDPTLPNPRGD